MAFETDGFLAEEMSGWIAGHRKESAAWFDLAGRFNRHCHVVAGNLLVSRENLQHLLCAPLFLRALEYFQGAVLMTERGMTNCAKVLLRTQLEAVFALCMVSKSPELAEKFVLSDWHTRSKALKKLKRAAELGISSLTPEQLANVDAALAECTTQLAAARIPKPNAEWLAQQAGMESSYLITYAYLSGPVHSGSRDIDKYEADAEGNVTHLAWGPDVKGSTKFLLSGVESISLGLRAIERIFGTDTSAHDALMAELSKLAQLMDEIGEPMV